MQTLARRFGAPITTVVEGEQFSPLINVELQALSKYILKYLESPTIIFSSKTDHTKRRAFFSQLLLDNRDAYDWFETNRLRYNNLLALTFLPDIYETVLSKLPNVKALLLSALKNIPYSADLYSLLTTNEKMLLTEKIATELKEVFIELQRIDATYTRSEPRKPREA